MEANENFKVVLEKYRDTKLYGPLFDRTRRWLEEFNEYKERKEREEYENLKTKSTIL